MKLARTFYGVICAVVAVSLTNCGVPGIPRPPSLNLAQPISDLRAVRKGDKVFLAWTVPVDTTDGTRMKKLGVTRICRNSDATSRDCSNSVGTVGPPPAEEASGKHSATQKTTENYTDQLSKAALSDNSAGELFYAVSVLNQNGRTAGLSNKVAVSAVPALPPPTDLGAAVTATGIALRWSGVSQAADTPGLRHLYRIYRREASTKVDIVVGELAFEASNTYSLVDHSFEWEKTYDYRATVVQVIHVDAQPQKQFEGDDTAPVRVFAHDIFPPAVPSGLQAVSSGPGQEQFVDLIWTPDTDPDLAGYNIFRHEEGGSEQKLNAGLVRTPAFRDSKVLPGHTYFYAVSAVDTRGNESTRSAEAKESVR